MNDLSVPQVRISLFVNRLRGSVLNHDEYVFLAHRDVGRISFYFQPKGDINTMASLREHLVGRYPHLADDSAIVAYGELLPPRMDFLLLADGVNIEHLIQFSPECVCMYRLGRFELAQIYLKGERTGLGPLGKFLKTEE